MDVLDTTKQGVSVILHPLSNGNLPRRTGRLVGLFTSLRMGKKHVFQSPIIMMCIISLEASQLYKERRVWLKFGAVRRG